MDFIKGEIFYDINFQYPDGGPICDKLLLVVNKKHTSPQDVVLVPCKTNKRNSILKPHCNENEKIFFVDKQIGANGFYRDNTIIQLFHIEIYFYDAIEEYFQNQRIKRLQKYTTQDEFSRILNCLKKMKDDISQEIQDLIF